MSIIPSESIVSFSGANSASLESESLPKLIPNFEPRSITSSFLAGLAFLREDLHTIKTERGRGQTMVSRNDTSVKFKIF